MNKDRRHCSLTLKITCYNEARTYKIKPVRPLPSNTAQGLWLENGNGKIYEINVSLDGYVGCSCQGFDSSKHCKHIDALLALGILNPEPFLQCRGLYLELIGERERIEEERKQLRLGEERFRVIRQIDSCYGTIPEPPVLQADPPAKPKRIRKKKSA